MPLSDAKQPGGELGPRELIRALSRHGVRLRPVAPLEAGPDVYRRLYDRGRDLIAGGSGDPRQVPGPLWRRLREIEAEVWAVLLFPEPEDPCPDCGGRIFLRGRPLWRCLSCEGIPSGIPEEWARIGAES